MKKERSNKFDYFTGGKSPEDKKKNALKKVWYWVKIVLYVFIFGVTLTGCVQNFTVSTASTAGNGLEFYLREKQIAPKVTSFTVSDSAKIEDNTDPQKPKDINLPAITENTGITFFLQEQSVIDKLRSQVAMHNGKYGAYGGLSSSIRLTRDGNSISPDPVYSQNGNYLIRANSETSYTPVTKLEPIYYLASAVETEPGTNNAKAVANANLIKTDPNDKNRIIWVSGLATIPVKFSNETDPTRILNIEFARDVLQLFYNTTFEDKKWTDIFNGKTPGEFYKTEIIEKLVDPNTKDNVRITNTQRLALLKYKEIIDGYTDKLGFETKSITGSDPSKYFVNNAAGVDYKRDSHLVFSGNELQKPITNWSEAWSLGPFYGLVVYPFGVLTQALRQSMPNLAGWASIFSIIIVVIIIKLIILAITFKSIVGQSLQEDLRGKKAQIEAKYEGFEKNKTMKMRKQQELQKLYKRHNINPLDQFLSMIIAMPMFLVMWRLVQGIPEIKSTFWLGINFSSTSYQSLFAGNVVYLWILIVAVLAQLSSQLLPRFLNRKKLKHRISIAESQALKKSEKTQKIITIAFVVMTVLFSAGVQVYWSISALFTALQTFGIYKLKKTNWWRTKYSLKFK